MRSHQGRGWWAGASYTAMGSRGGCLVLSALPPRIGRKHLQQEHRCMPWVAAGLYRLLCSTMSPSAWNSSARMLQQRWGCGGDHRQPAPQFTSERVGHKRCSSVTAAGGVQNVVRRDQNQAWHMCVCVCVWFHNASLSAPPATPVSSKKSRTAEHRPKATQRCIKALFFPLLEELTQPPQMFPAYLNCESETTMEILAWLDKV